MLQIQIPSRECWDEKTNSFITVKGQTLTLEHSLVSISKWESKWEKPFISDKPKTNEETVDYIRCMTMTQNVDPNVYANIDAQIIKQVNDYISAPMTATWFGKREQAKTGGKGNGIVTAEKIYYWMIALQIPFECQKWHLNRLLTLIKVCEAENEPNKKMSKKALASRNKALNSARRKRLGTKG